MLWLLALIALLLLLLIWRITAEAGALRGSLHAQTNRLLSRLEEIEARLHSIDLHASQLPKMRQPGEP